jgi:uncharacterized repeat protein (TIGR01451 family)
VTSIVTLRNLSFGNPQPLVDFNDTGNFVNCNASQCTRLSFANGTLVFNVTTFTTYSSEEGGVNITLTKTDSPDPVNTGGVLNYTITVTVVASNASNITLTDTYPLQVVFNTAQPAPLAGTNNTFIIGNLTGGQSFTVNITVNVTSGITNGTVINNTANISFQNQTGTQLNQSVTEGTTVLAAATAAQFNLSNVSIVKLDSPDPVNASSSLSYTIVINATADSPANITLTDIYPNEVVFQSGQPSPLAGTNNTFIIGNLTENQTFTVNITVLVLNVSNGTVINNTANISFHNQTGALVTASASASTTIIVPETAPQLNLSNVSVTKSDSPDPVNSSANLTYIINVTSNGNGTAYNVTVNDTYPAQVIFLTAQPTPVSGTNNTFILGNMTANQSILINITVFVLNVSNNTVINNSVNVTFQNETSGLFSAIDTESTTVANVTIAPQFNLSNISVSKADLQDPVENNTQLNYTVTVTSSGNGTAYNVTLTETYPPQVVFNTAQPTPISGNTTFILGNLSPGIVVIVNITVNVTSGLANGTVINNSVNVTFQNETSALFSATDIETTTVQNTSTVSAGAPSPGGGGGGGGGRVGIGGVQQPAPEAPALITGACTESWACEGWSPCVEGRQVRECTDLGRCNTTVYLPLTSRACVEPVQESPESLVRPDLQPPELELAPPALPAGLPWKWITTVLIILLCIAVLTATFRAGYQPGAQQRMPPMQEMRLPPASQRVPRNKKGFYSKLDEIEQEYVRIRRLDKEWILQKARHEQERAKEVARQKPEPLPVPKLASVKPAKPKIGKEAKDFYQRLRKYDDDLDKLEAQLQKKLKKR